MAYRKRRYSRNSNRSNSRRSYSRRRRASSKRTASRTRDIRIVIEQQPMRETRYPNILSKVNPAPKTAKF